MVLGQGVAKERIVTRPSLLVIEILSPEDRLGRFQDRIDDYLGFGIENIWIISPERRTAHRATRTGIHVVENCELSVPDTPIKVNLSELFAELDRA